MFISFVSISLNIGFSCKIIVWGAFLIHPALSRPYKLVYFIVVVTKDEYETLLHDRGKFLSVRRVSERCVKIVRLSNSLKNIWNTNLQNGKRELYGINLDESRFLAENVLSRATCLSMSQSGVLAFKLDGCGLRIYQAIKRIRRGE